MSLHPMSSSKSDPHQGHSAVADLPKSQPGKRGYAGWAKRIVVSIVALLFGLVIITLLLGAKAKADLIAQYPPLGQMVDVGGYQLHISCQGEGSPTVVMESGLGDPS